jgi:hypothetical protein
VSGAAPLPRLSEAADRLLKDFSPAASLFLRLAETDVTVSSDSPALIDSLSGYFREFSRAPGPTGIVIRLRTAPPVPPDFCPGLVLADRPFDPREKTSKEQWADLPDGRVVRKKRTGMVFVFGADLHLAAGPCLEHADQVVNFINFRGAARHLSNGSLLAHAAGVAKGKRGLLLAGTAGAGKSTLALRLVGRGLLRVQRPPPGQRGLAAAPPVRAGQTAPNQPRHGIGRSLPEPRRARTRTVPVRLPARRGTVAGRTQIRRGHRGLFRPRAVLPLDRSVGRGRVHLAPRRRTDYNGLRRPGATIGPPGRDHQASGIFLAAPPVADHDARTFSQRLRSLPAFEFSGGMDFSTAAARLLRLLGD